MLEKPSFLPSSASLTALGSYVPHERRTNSEIESRFSKPVGWIHARTGIRERRIAAADEFASDLCVAAVHDLVSRSHVDISDVDLVIGATTSPDYSIPSMACLVQDKLGLEHAGAFDIQASCSSFVYGLQIANALVTSGTHRKILVVAGETMSKILNPDDLSTHAVFGDGAGAALVEYSERGAFLAASSGSYGAGAPLIYREDPGQLDVTDGSHSYFQMNGPEVYRWVTQNLSDFVREVTARAGLALADIDWFIPHSANARMIEKVCQQLGFPMKRTLLSLECFGNTSAASIPLALTQSVDLERLRPGDKVLLYGFGAGLSHAGVLLEWGLGQKRKC